MVVDILPRLVSFNRREIVISLQNEERRTKETQKGEDRERGKVLQRRTKTDEAVLDYGVTEPMV